LVVAQLALLVGVTTPEKFYFDEVHYVPAARQMLEPVMPRPMLNPMHPPPAKELMAVSIRVFGDAPLGRRYPSVLFGSLAIVAMYRRGLALFAAQGPALASALIAFFNQMVFVQSRIAAVVFLGNPLVPWPALPALLICLHDWIVTRRADAFLILSFYFGPYLAWAMQPRTLGFI
jgi:dolichyl-phosphate-mannose--protein O-mannosyl transferase